MSVNYNLSSSILKAKHKAEFMFDNIRKLGTRSVRKQTKLL